MKHLSGFITKDSTVLATIKSEFPKGVSEDLEKELNLMIERAFMMKCFEGEWGIEDWRNPIKLAHREKQALFMLEKGMKNREMAKSLNNNEKSVSTYVARIKTKLKLSNDCNTYQLVKVALMLGLIPLEMPQDKPKKKQS